MYAASKVYDGAPAEIVTDTVSGYDGRVPEVKYYRAGTAAQGGLSPVNGVPTDAGMYYVEATVAETLRYAGEIVLHRFFILKANPNPNIPVLPDMQMTAGLSLSQQALPDGWAWIVPEKALQVGGVRELARYTPQDTVNYRSIYAYLSFAVKPDDDDVKPDDDGVKPNDDGVKPNDDGADPEGSDTSGSDANGDGAAAQAARTGDAHNLILWICVAIGSALIWIVALRNRKRNR